MTIAWEAHIGGFLAGLFAFSFFDRRPDQALLVGPEPEPGFEPSMSSQTSGPSQTP
jgi:hypothetical protein